MPRVTWSAQAGTELEVFVAEAAVREQLKRNAEETLHDIDVSTADEGVADGIMWHRGVTDEFIRRSDADEYESFSEQADGPWNYFLFYRRRQSDSGFEVLAVPGVHQIASVWQRMNEETAEATDALSP